MADTAELTNRIILRSIMPLFKVIHEANGNGFLRPLSRFDGVIQFAVDKTDTGAYLVFEGDKLSVEQGVHPDPDIYIGFRSITAMNAMFTGGSPKEIGLPTLRGIWKLPLLVRLGILFPGLLMLMPDNNPTEPDKRELKVRMTMYMVTNALSQLNKGGLEDMVNWTRKQPDRIYQISIEPDGDAAYLRVKAGKTKAGRGRYKRKAPFVHMRFNSLDAAYGVLCEGKDTLRAIADGDMVLAGSPEYGGGFGNFMMKVQDLVTN